MSKRIAEVFEKAQAEGRPAFVGYVTAGYPTLDSTVPLLKALEAGGTDIIELGVPFTDPIADGVTLQKTSEIALKNGVTLQKIFDAVKQARDEGVKAPIVLMGYYNPYLAYGEEKAVKTAAKAGVDGFIVVDVPTEEATSFSKICKANEVSLVPLVTVTTTAERLKHLTAVADTFVYCVSVTGITGERSSLPADLGDFVKRVRAHTSLPLAVGFGVSTKEHVDQISSMANGVVVGSAIAKQLDTNGIDGVRKYIQSLTVKTNGSSKHTNGLANGLPNGLTNGVKESKAKAEEVVVATPDRLPSRFGIFGGQYVPETLMAALQELEDAYIAAKKDPSFFEELRSLQKHYVGRPTPLHLAKRLTEHAGGARIWIKREDLAHTGAHKINNTIGQVLLAKRLGKKRVVAETGAGQHGVASATVCALMGLDCHVYMGAEDVKRQSLNVFRMKVLGATVHPVTSGSATLKDAVNEAMRDWVTNVRSTYYLIGSAIGPHPFPTIVRDFQSVIGIESRQQMLDQAGKLPDAVLACVGGGSNAIGMFHPFIKDANVKLIGTEAGGHGVETGKHSAPLVAGKPGVLHGMMTYLMQDTDGQILETHSISAGLDYPGVGPEHCMLKSTGRADYVGVTDDETLEGLQALAKYEGIICALESAHAVYKGIQMAKTMNSDQDLLINLSGRGDKDMITVAKSLGHEL
mmetsp:Transcript_36771/g.59422  ORF Transcript_36771/g.59422 Transcript_36771/m.59422 type:complete len:691 (+) Transcript_36771:97-2169(+)|eukprot:CAMPEP_0184657452 /NCGR_PEP_ID=MMETSP0308-20130426/19707_1 /TAXON_ID=38269 /ORGANISM="Gloeochaete witrockiana, Strain SAG 46.84" /LENGTH=690 /DNA_ID=CAMNT_0027095301 /DNA_START=33 /DNA_END=2105 /DNA_ORIENTATION=-